MQCSGRVYRKSFLRHTAHFIQTPAKENAEWEFIVRYSYPASESTNVKPQNVNVNVKRQIIQRRFAPHLPRISRCSVPQCALTLTHFNVFWYNNVFSPLPCSPQQTGARNTRWWCWAAFKPLTVAQRKKWRRKHKCINSDR